MKDILGLIFPQLPFVFKNEVKKFNQGFFLHLLPPSVPPGLKVNKILLTLVEGTVNQRLVE